MAKELIIENYIEIDGEDVLLESLSKEERAETVSYTHLDVYKRQA